MDAKLQGWRWWTQAELVDREMSLSGKSVWQLSETSAPLRSGDVPHHRLTVRLQITAPLWQLMFANTGNYFNLTRLHAHHPFLRPGPQMKPVRAWLRLAFAAISFFGRLRWGRGGGRKIGLERNKTSTHIHTPFTAPFFKRWHLNMYRRTYTNEQSYLLRTQTHTHACSHRCLQAWGRIFSSCKQTVTTRATFFAPPYNPHPTLPLPLLPLLRHPGLRTQTSFFSVFVFKVVNPCAERIVLQKYLRSLTLTQ